MASPHIVTLTTQNFEAEALKSTTPILVDFWAEWCGPCKAIGPTLDELANEYAGKAKIGKVNVDEQQDLAAKYNVRSIPTLLFIKNGDVVEQAVGAKGKGALKASLDKLIA